MFSGNNKPNPAVDGYQHPSEQAELGAASNFANNNNNYANNQPQYHNRPAGQQAPIAGKPNPLNLSMFAADCCVMLGALVSFFSEFFSIQWVNALEMSYLFIFGLILAVLDTPLIPNHQIIRDYQFSITKYIALLSRVTGKGAVYIFLGCALASSMWAKNEKSGFMIFVAVLIGFFVVLVGLMVLSVGLLKSRNLNLVRQELRKDNTSLEQLYTQHAKLHPQSGLTKEEFKTMTPYARGVAFEDADLHLIFNALSTSFRQEYITHDDMLAWVRGSWPVLI
jgi:hypothetical protein|mmetsp:Transcript_12528/g.20644  ORF Transcript_12528/g.20644 Transcript_12528/m.20644 type:complete len:280 (-) Transcript_12528:134-973(-)